MLADYLKVEGNGSLVRDMSTHAIINTNSAEYDNYKKKASFREAQNEEILKNSNDINIMKQELSEIKELLLLLVQK